MTHMEHKEIHNTHLMSLNHITASVLYNHLHQTALERRKEMTQT